MSKTVIEESVLFNGQKYKGTCLVCKHAISHIEVDKVVCSKDLDLRKGEIKSGKPTWCPLVQRSELDYIKSC